MIYDYKYFTARPHMAEQMFWDNNQIRYGDQLAAIGYAFGYRDFEKIKQIVGFKANGGKISLNLKLKDLLWEIHERKIREPYKILDVGGGRGEVSFGLSYLGYDVTLLEPGKDVYRLLTETSRKFMMPVNFKVINGYLKDIDYDYDTAIFCESIEHIPEPEIREFFAKFKGRVIITNWINFHPILLDGVDHVTLIDDKFYDSLPGKVIYREGSHLILDL